jgi:hypothetical protein
LTLGEEGRESRPGKAADTVVEEVAGLPTGKELGVEVVEAVDLEVRVEQRDNATEDALAAIARCLEQSGESREVERELSDAPASQLRDRAGDEEFGEAVRRRGPAAHSRE